MSTDASDAASRAYLHALPREEPTAQGVTALPLATEDALRVALATIFAFDPVELLPLRHVLSGGTYATFTEPLRELRDRLGAYDLEPNAAGFRSLAQTWAARMARQYPPLAGFFKASVEANRSRNAEHLAQVAAR